MHVLDTCDVINFVARVVRAICFPVFGRDTRNLWMDLSSNHNLSIGSDFEFLSLDGEKRLVWWIETNKI